MDVTLLSELARTPDARHRNKEPIMTTAESPASSRTFKFAFYNTVQRHAILQYSFVCQALARHLQVTHYETAARLSPQYLSPAVYVIAFKVF